MKIIFYPLIFLMLIVGIPLAVTLLLSPTFERLLVVAGIVISLCLIQAWAKITSARMDREAREEYKRRFPNG